MAAPPSFPVLLLTQGIGVVGELFGQRCTRQLYNHSSMRVLAAVTVFSALQAFVLLSIAQLVLPTSWTQGQGPLSMLSLLWQHPGLLINAFVNTFYWIAQVYVLREPLGVILVVMAFVVASFCIDPFAAIVSMPTAGNLRWDAVLLGVVGTILCVTELASTPLWFSRCLSVLPGSMTVPRAASEQQGIAVTQAAGSGEAEGDGEPQQAVDDDTVELIVTPSVTRSSGHSAPSSSSVSSPRERRGQFNAVHTVGLVAAFVMLAVTAGMGIVITKYFEEYAGLSNTGYATIDQVLLPFTILPVIWLAGRFPWLAKLFGEPVPMGDSLPAQVGLWSLLKLTWQQTHLLTLVPFRLLMLCREFFFFYLATTFDLAPTYLQMTLIRVVLSWLAAICACTLLRNWIGVTSEEKSRTLSAFNMLLKLSGTALILWAIVLLHNGDK